MGNWTVYLNSKEEEQIKMLISRGKFQSFYAFIRFAVRELLEDKDVEERRVNLLAFKN